jgi:hypothetical protein
LLFVADTDNSRVLVFNVGTITNGMNASHVLGQADYTTDSASTAQAGLAYPEGLAYDSNDHLLFVADDNSNRVVAYNTNALSNGMNASYVLGQSNYTNNSSADTQTGLNTPDGLAYDSNDNLLFVSDTQNRRVVAYNTNALSNGMNASYVLGQPNFTSRALLDTQSGTSTDQGIAYDSLNHQLFVSDSNNDRILSFNIANISSGMNASGVIGQSNFTTGSGLPGAASQSGFSGGATSSYNLGLAFDPGNNRLYAVDDANSRVLAFNFVQLTTASLPAATQKSAYSASLASTNSEGTVTYAVTSGALPAGITLNSSTGALSGTPTTAGAYNFEITATDTAGTAGSFMDDPAYTITVGAASSSVGAPDTGFGVFTTSPIRTLTEFGVAAIALFGIALTIRKFAKR